MHKDDEKWCMDMIMKLPPPLRPRAIQGYREAHHAALESEPCEVKKEGVARREANTRLRLFVNKVNNL